VGGLKLEGFVVGGKGFGLGCGILFERDAAGEPDGGLVLARSGFGLWDRSARDDFLASGEIHYKLSGDGLEEFALVTEGDAVMLGGGGSSGLDQRVTHAGGLLLHGFERLADYGRANPHGAEVANFFDLEQIGERVGRTGRDESCTLQLASWRGVR